MIARGFRRLSIRGKLTAMLLLTSAAALVVSSASYMIWDHFRFRSDTIRQLSTQAQMVLDNTTAAISFRDPEAAGETLATLSPNQHIVAACLYDPSHALFAEYRRSPQTEICPPRAPVNGYAFTSQGIDLAASATVAGSLGGSLYLRSDLQEVTARLQAETILTLLVLCAALGVALVISASVQRVVSEPVEVLATVARGVSDRGDYSLRAPKLTDDELGVLVDAFNGMLGEIERRITHEQDANRLKDEFLAGLSHELRTPLNATFGWLQILRSEESDPDDVERALTSLERNARLQARLIEDLVDVSLIVTGKLQISQDVVDLREVLQTAAESVAPAARRKSISITTDVPEAPCLVTGDFVRLQQVVSNVLGNAVKFTPANGKVGLSLAPQAGDYVIAVTDTGIGIAPEFLPHVFERFRQADGSVTRQHGGLGLGLAIVLELVLLHRGGVTANSSGPGHGATFVIRLPQRGSAADPTVSSGSTAGRTTGTSLNAHVLIVDDDEDSLEIATRVLEAHGCVVETAESGNAAVAVWGRRRFDVLVCDLAMPLVDGFSVLKAVRAMDAAAGRFTPAVAVTAHASEAFRRQSVLAGFQGHLAKPYDAALLVTAVAGALASASAGPASG